MNINQKGFTKDVIETKTSLREGEEKLGQVIHYWNDQLSDFGEWLKEFKGKFVIIGVKESIGPKANMGKSGAELGFDSFINSFLNIQNNRYISSEQISLGGYIEVSSSNSDISALKEEVASLDFHVCEIAKSIFQNNKIPIVIGGGHNNAYPLIKAFYEAKQSPISILNIDPHADFRSLEGRHSGNSFSYAMDEKMIKNYLIYGLHESYNSEAMLQKMEQNNSISWVTFEKILCYDNPSEQLLRYVDRLLHEKTGLEIDMDSIAGMPVSAFTPSGFTLEQVRTILIKAVRHLSIYYLHLPEAAPKNDKEMIITGKALSYLVTDFIKNVR